MSDTPIEHDGSNAALPPDYQLVAWQPDPIAITAEDLDPPPYVANAVEPIAGADFGLGIRHIENQLFITFDTWPALSVGDAFEYYMGDTRFAKAEDEIRSGEATQRRYQLAIPRELVPTGSVFPCYGRVVRAGTGRESTSVQQEVFIKGTRPGGADQDPKLPYHSALKVHLPPDLQGPGAVLDPERAKAGVLCLIERYPEIYLGDTIELHWNGLPVTLQLDADHVAGLKPIEVLVPQAVIERGGSGRVTIRFRVHDLVFNYSGELQQWSQAVHLDTELDPNLLMRPFFLVDDVESTDVNFDTQGGSVFEIEVVVPSTLPDGTRAPPGSQIVVTLAGILLDGSSLVKQLPPFAARLDRSAFTDVDNDLIKQLINGSVQISYELQFPLGTVIGRSQRLMVTVFGTFIAMPPVTIVEDESGLIDPDEPFITVEFPEYTPYNRDYPVTLRMEAPLPGGRVEFYEQTLQAGDPPPPTRFRIVPNDQFQRFVGLGEVRVFYLVNTGTGDPLPSEPLLVKIGERVTDMPKPQIEGLDLLDNLDPANVIGQALVKLPYINRLLGCTYVWRWVGSGVGGSTDGRINADFWIGNEVEFAVGKAFVDANLDGEIRLSYSLERPGAQTLRSEVRVITVGKSLGDLPRPEVREASKSPDQLPPEAASAGATVVVEFDQMRPTDRIEMRWSGVSGIGTHTETKDGNTRKSVEFKVPAETIGVNIAPGGREINVQYFLVRGATHPLPSRILTLRLLPLTTLPIPAIEGVADNPVLDTSTLNNGARTLVNVWPFANRAQRKWLTYTGVKADGSPYTENTYTGELVNVEGETQGLLAPTPVNALRQLKDGSTLTIQAWISFERSTNKATALLFRERNYLVQALASVLPHPTLNGASGTGANVTVEPLSIENNTRVTVTYDGMRSTDRITLKWVYADAQAYSATLNGLDSGTQVFTLPVDVLARSVNSSVQVCYSVERSGVPGTVPSYVQTVTVNTLPAGSLPDPRINNLATGATLDIASLTTSSSFTIAQWPMQYSGMKIWLTFSCPGASPTTYSPWTGHAHNSANGVSTTLNQAWLDWLRTCPDGQPLSIQFKAGYANNSNEAQAVSFPVTSYTAYHALPGVLPHPTLNGASDTGASVTVEPLSIENSTYVTVTYEMRSTDQIDFRWIYANGQEHTATMNGRDSGTQVFTIPSTVLARSVNSTVQLRYSVRRTGVTTPVPSYVQTVGVNTIPANSLPYPQINDMATGSTLDVASMTTASTLTIARWPLQYSNMKVWLSFSCPGASPATYTSWTGTEWPGTNGVSTSFSNQATLNWLNTCPNGAQLSIMFKAGYANNSTEAQAVSFPVTTYTVRRKLSITWDFNDNTFQGWEPMHYYGHAYNNLVVVGGVVQAYTNGNYNFASEFMRHPISVTAGSTYDVGFSVRGIPSGTGLFGSMIRLRTTQGAFGDIIDTQGQAIWRPTTAWFTASVTGTIQLSLENLVTSGNGNDFLIDNIWIKER